MNLLKAISHLLVICAVAPLFSQSSVITGQVEDRDGIAILGANIYIRDTYDGTSSAMDGSFHFTTRETGKALLLCSYLGYQQYEEEISLQGDSLYLTITLRENTLQMGEITITAGSFEAGGEHKREILQPLDIVTTAGATADLAGVFNTLPGTGTVGETGRLFVRGGEGYETKTFIDGMEVLNFYTPSAPNTPGRSRFLPFMFSGASFSTGGYSAEYGQALSSALILNSNYIATTSRVDLSLLTVGADASFTKAWPETSLSGKIQYTNLDPYFSVLKQDIDWIDPPTSLTGMASFRAKWGENGLIKWYGNFNRSSLELFQPQIADPTRKDRIRIDNRYIYLNTYAYRELEGGLQWKSGISITSNRDDLDVGITDLTTSEYGLHVKSTFKKDLSGKSKLHFGGEYFHHPFSQKVSSQDGNDEREREITEDLFATFVETDIQLLNPLLARLGIRAEYSGLTGELHVAPRLSLALKTGDNSQISAAFGIFQQAPQNDWRVVASDLKNEQAIHYILNYQISGEGRTFRIEGYHKDYSSLVRFDPSQENVPSGYDNGGSGFARGIDLFWRDNRSINNADYWISYSYLDTERQYLDYPIRTMPAFATKHNFSVVYKQFINPLKTQLGWTYTFASGRPYRDPNLSEFTTRYTNSYHDLSLNLSYLARQNIIVHVSVTNVLGAAPTFGYQFSEQPNTHGVFAGRAIRPPAKRFLFLGVFFTISKEQTLNQLPNL